MGGIRDIAGPAVTPTSNSSTVVIESVEATKVVFDNTGTALTSTDIQGAVAELDAVVNP